MKRKYIFLISSFLMVSCGSVKKKTTYASHKEPKITVEAQKDNLGSLNYRPVHTNLEKTKASPIIADEIINSALAFSGTRYKFGGTSKKGMDCSGLMYVAFSDHDIALPRVSHAMADEGKNIMIKDVVKGDLLFFKTSRKAKKINHVGLVIDANGDEIRFIHATTSRGVIVSSLKEGYWNYAFVKATRVL